MSKKLENATLLLLPTIKISFLFKSSASYGISVKKRETFQKTEAQKSDICKLHAYGDV